MNDDNPQAYFCEGLSVYRASVGADLSKPARKQQPPPFMCCEAASARMAKRIVAALSLYVPRTERAAVERKILKQIMPAKVDAIKRAFSPRGRV